MVAVSLHNRWHDWTILVWCGKTFGSVRLIVAALPPIDANRLGFLSVTYMVYCIL